MIFWFSGTGNSLHAARRLSEALHTPLVSIADALQKNQTAFDDPDGLLGFVCPVYWWGLPTVAADFVKTLTLPEKAGRFVFALLTCEADAGGAPAQLQRLLGERGLSLSAAHVVKMPDNYVLMLQPPTPAKAAEILLSADEAIDAAAKSLAARETPPIPPAPPVTALLNRYYQNPRHRRVARFRTTDACTGCGLCQRLCPCQSITLREGRPVWSGDCTRCLGCINRCPTQAIQYGIGSRSRRRYVHPTAFRDNTNG